MSKKNIVINSGDILTNKKSSSKLIEDIGSLFTSKFGEAYSSEDHKPGIRDRDIKTKKNNTKWETVSKNKTHKDINSEPVDTKKISSVEEWRKVLGDHLDSKTLSSKAIMPSRSDRETNDFGRAILPTRDLYSLDSKIKNNPLTEIVIKDAQKKKLDRENNKARNNDWEVVEAAKSSKDTKPSQMGFTPNRSSLGQSEIPKVKIKEVESLKRQAKENESLAVTAKEIKESINDMFVKNFNKKAKDTRKWEDQKVDEISAAQRRNMDIKNDDIKIGKDFTSLPKDFKVDDKFKNLFSKKENKELIIKSEKNTKEPRKKREDDRSWEVPSLPKKRK